MVTKLTLTIEAVVIEKAKHYAKHTGRSLSDLVERYLETLTEAPPDEKISSRLKKIAGAVKLPDDFDEKEALLSYFEKKHL
ncbi:DUF6364 family protein [Niabella soli]|uniref:Antitoxin n=1 Tax=Niabella soli DSM 19437 TaxID=929713 RepID=W0F4Y1_9BACT|nr:DUF6364 family protein [Niabella soli]AHF16381.1 hypothetical protein NIASO_16875 [Niabella soli DSM 19437]